MTTRRLAAGALAAAAVLALAGCGDRVDYHVITGRGENTRYYVVLEDGTPIRVSERVFQRCREGAQWPECSR